MQKNRKSSKSVRIFSKVDLVLFWSTNFICFLLILFSLYKFHSNMLSSFEKIDEKPVAVVADRIRTSRRCLGTRTIWDYLQKDSKIYNGDTIRTEENSQVVLSFEDGLVLTLTPKTLTTISVDENKGLQILLSGGNIIVDSVKKDSSTTVVYNKTNISMTGKAMVSAAEVVEKKKLEVQVFEGTAEVQTGNKEKVSVTDGQMVTVKPIEILTEDNTVYEDEISNPVSVLEGNPEPVVVLVDVKEDFSVPVVDNANINQLLVNKELVLEMEAESDLSQILIPQEEKTSVEIITLIQNLEKQPEVKKEAEVIKAPETKKENKKNVVKKTMLAAPSIAGPANNKVLTDNYFISSSGIDFSWATVTGATNYQFILKDSNGKILVSKKLGKVNHYLFSDLVKLSNGKFEWSVQALKCNASGTVVEKSEVRKATFIIRLGEISGDAQSLGEVFGKER